MTTVLVTLVLIEAVLLAIAIFEFSRIRRNVNRELKKFVDTVGENAQLPAELLRRCQGFVEEVREQRELFAKEAERALSRLRQQ